jgi:hypothetical protein
LYFSTANTEEIAEGLTGLLMSKKYPKTYNAPVSFEEIIEIIFPERHACTSLIGTYILHRKNIRLLG